MSFAVHRQIPAARSDRNRLLDRLDSLFKLECGRICPNDVADDVGRHTGGERGIRGVVMSGPTERNRRRRSFATAVDIERHKQ
jgi:hypothetical protein